MYVCVCSGVTQRQLEQAVVDGAHSLTALQKELNLGTNCGTCLPHAKRLLNSNLNTLVAQNPSLYYAA